ncbi:hypothetical protein GWN26_08220, partial [Candidatus Saccharibacteria bacterium]|nr:hypothetical protein [Candidatus Saccharibacteria bacterium]NIW79396.1 hypothetical protein [Calditrichia bacterium]
FVGVAERVGESSLGEVEELTVCMDIDEHANAINFSIDEKVDIIALLHGGIIGKGAFMVGLPIPPGR